MGWTIEPASRSAHLILGQGVVPVEAVVTQRALASRAPPTGALEPDGAQLEVAHVLTLALLAPLSEAIAVQLRELGVLEAQLPLLRLFTRPSPRH